MQLELFRTQSTGDTHTVRSLQCDYAHTAMHNRITIYGLSHHDKAKATCKAYKLWEIVSVLPLRVYFQEAFDQGKLLDISFLCRVAWLYPTSLQSRGYTPVVLSHPCPYFQGLSPSSKAPFSVFVWNLAGVYASIFTCPHWTDWIILPASFPSALPGKGEGEDFGNQNLTCQRQIDRQKFSSAESSSSTFWLLDKHRVLGD